jgi:hypothetical protein
MKRRNFEVRSDKFLPVQNTYFSKNFTKIKQYQETRVFRNQRTTTVSFELYSKLFPILLSQISFLKVLKSQSQWPNGLRRGSTAACLLGSRIRIPLGAWMFVSRECCVFVGRGLCDGSIPRPEESYWTWRVIVCDLQTSSIRRPWPALGCCARKKSLMRNTCSVLIVYL